MVCDCDSDDGDCNNGIVDGDCNGGVVDGDFDAGYNGFDKVYGCDSGDDGGYNCDYGVLVLVLFCSSLLGERINPTGYCPIDRGSEDLRFNVLIREDAKGSPFTDVMINAKAALSSQLF